MVVRGKGKLNSCHVVVVVALRTLIVRLRLLHLPTKPNQIKDMDDVIGRDIPQLMARTPGLMDPDPEADNPFGASAANPFAGDAAPSSAPGVGWAVAATDKCVSDF